MSIQDLRLEFHARILEDIVRIQSKGNVSYPNFADVSSAASIAIARGVVEQLGSSTNTQPLAGQSAGSKFEVLTRNFLESCFERLQHLRPGRWRYATERISKFAQYAHLHHLQEMVEKDNALRVALGGDYIIKPDIVIVRAPVSDKEINYLESLVTAGEKIASLTPFREANYKPAREILHASISCKWSIRSDRAQNTRAEALNLIRNRKGPLPHAVAVTAEPLPTRIASLALGTGDLDCVYHFALHELEAAVQSVKNEDQLDMLQTMIQGSRLRDISDLPFDLAI